MKTTGFLLREAIRRWELRRDTAANQFSDSLFKFKDEEKATPDEIAKDFITAEVAVARLQTAQSRYNLLVTVDVLGESMPLGEAVKRLGGAGRIDKMWRDAAGKKKDRYAYRDDNTRKADEERAQPTVSAKDAMVRSHKTSAFASALRAAIATGNGTSVESDQLQLDVSLLTE